MKQGGKERNVDGEWAKEKEGEDRKQRTGGKKENTINVTILKFYRKKLF